jgi:hypothetical protein
LLDLIRVYIVTESPRGSLVTFIPIDSQVNEVTLVDGHDPVVREVLVYYLSHLGHLLVKDLWNKAEENEDDRGLLS